MPKMKSNFRGLVTLLAKNLYPEPDVFVRELIQNAHDSIRLRAAHPSDYAGRIHITVDPANRTITFSDDGLGMTREIIDEFLSTIGASGTGTMTHQLKEGTQCDVATIGQFGIGLLSAFVVAERVDVFTRHFKTDEAWHWVNLGDDEYTLHSTAEMPNVGTQVIVTVKAEFSEFLKEELLEATIRKYADLLGVPIFLNCCGPINSVRPPWEVAATLPEAEREAYLINYLTKRFPDYPLLLIPVNLPDRQTHGLLYITDQPISGLNTSGFVDLYQNRMALRPRDTDLLPEWARFVRGIVDSRSLQPTAARDNVHRNAAYQDLRRELGELIIQAILRCAQDNPEFFNKLCQWHHFHFKGLCVVDHRFFDRLAMRLPFETSDGTMSLEQYRDRQTTATDQPTPIYYFQNEADAARFYDVCRARRIVAINASLCFEESLLRKLMDRQPGKWTLRRLDSHDSSELYQPLPAFEAESFQPLLQTLTTTLKELGLLHIRVGIRRFAPTNTSGVLLDVRSHVQLETLQILLKHPAAFRDLGTLQAEISASLDRAELELLLNADNPLVQWLAHQPELEDPVSQLALRGLYYAALLQSKGRVALKNSQAIHACLQESLSQTLAASAGTRQAQGESTVLRKLVADRNEALTASEWVTVVKSLYHHSPAQFREQIARSNDEQVAEIVGQMLTLGAGATVAKQKGVQL